MSARIGRSKEVAATLVALGCALPALAQCAPQWSAYPGPQLNAPIRTLTTWDPDGAGPALPVVVAGGYFQHAGSTPLSFVGAWDGVAWHPLGPGVGGAVECATLFNPVGSGPPRLAIGGWFSQSGSTTLNGIAWFDGSQWMPFGSGFGPPGSNPTVYCLAPWAGMVVAGGSFETAGGLPAHDAAWWDGLTWHAFTSELLLFSTFYSYSGSLYAGGLFQQPTGPGYGVLRWTGQAWEPPGQGTPAEQVYAMTTYRGQLVAGGFAYPGSFSGIASFDGTAWHSLGSGVDFIVYALTTWSPNGPGTLPELLIAGGNFSTAGGQPASCIAAWDGTQWTPLGPGTSDRVRALTVWNNQLVVGGDFYTAGGLTSPGMAFWGCPQPAYCYPNCDQSTTPPVLNINDFVCFLDAFAAASPYSNCDGSTQAPAMNILDFVCFLNRFAAGCS